MSTTPNKETVLALIKRLRQKPSTYNRELLDEAADTIVALLEALEETEGCDTCKYLLLDANAEPCYSCHSNNNKWEWAEEAGEAPRWEDDRGGVVCSVCGYSCNDTFYLGAGRYCPECGAKMTEPLRSEGGES